jgi:hypothetical protein
MQTLSNLLWAGFGINRPDGRRTAPSASNKQEIDIYVATADTLYVYEAKGNRLHPLLREDIRAKTGIQTFVGEAPMNLVYVADLAKTGTDSARCVSTTLRHMRREFIEFYSLCWAVC